jgi:hypothetical protein
MTHSQMSGIGVDQDVQRQVQQDEQAQTVVIDLRVDDEVVVMHRGRPVIGRIIWDVGNNKPAIRFCRPSKSVQIKIHSGDILDFGDNGRWRGFHLFHA